MPPQALYKTSRPRCSNRGNGGNFARNFFEDPVHLAREEQNR